MVRVRRASARKGLALSCHFDLLPDLVEVAVEGGADQDASPLDGEAAPQQQADDLAALADLGAVLVDDVAAEAERGALVGEKLPEPSPILRLVDQIRLDPEDGVGVDEPPLEAIDVEDLVAELEVAAFQGLPGPAVAAQQRVDQVRESRVEQLDAMHRSPPFPSPASPFRIWLTQAALPARPSP